MKERKEKKKKKRKGKKRKEKKEKKEKKEIRNSSSLSFRSPQSAILLLFLSFRNSQSAIRNSSSPSFTPQPAIRNSSPPSFIPQSAIRNPQFFSLCGAFSRGSRSLSNVVGCAQLVSVIAVGKSLLATQYSENGGFVNQFLRGSRPLPPNPF
ncbi:MAG: hypothetical protein ACPGWR_32100 [Ardenticatenaceae bacterium]